MVVVENSDGVQVYFTDNPARKLTGTNPVNFLTQLD